MDSLRWSGGVAGIKGVVFHLAHNDHGFSNLKGFIMGVKRGGGRVVFRRGDTFTNMVSQRSVAELQENLFFYYAAGGAEVWGWHWNPQKRWQ